MYLSTANAAMLPLDVTTVRSTLNCIRFRMTRQAILAVVFTLKMNEASIGNTMNNNWMLSDIERLSRILWRASLRCNWHINAFTMRIWNGANSPTTMHIEPLVCKMQGYSVTGVVVLFAAIAGSALGGASVSLRFANGNRNVLDFVEMCEIEQKLTNLVRVAKSLPVL